MLTRRLTRLLTFQHGLAATTPEVLKAVAQEKRYPLLMREAAIRWLVHWAPLAVTQGAPFSVRRRHVRQHYGV